MISFTGGIPASFLPISLDVCIPMFSLVESIPPLTLCFISVLLLLSPLSLFLYTAQNLEINCFLFCVSALLMISAGYDRGLEEWKK